MMASIVDEETMVGSALPVVGRESTSRAPSALPRARRDQRRDTDRPPSARSGAERSELVSWARVTTPGFERCSHAHPNARTAASFIAGQSLPGSWSAEFAIG
jgi:hypothetical protein